MSTASNAPEQSTSIVHVKTSSYAPQPSQLWRSSSTTLWPPKYATQREPIPEIPRSCVEKLFVEMDTDMNGRIAYEEVQAFAKKSNLAFISPDVVHQMFQEISQRRALVHQEQLESPITTEELIACCNIVSFIN